MPESFSEKNIIRYNKGRIENVTDYIIKEEPLEIQLIHGPLLDRKQKSLAITMRTPGDDGELALGFLFSEGIIDSFDDVIIVKRIEPENEFESTGNVLIVELSPTVNVDEGRLDRHFYTTSSCGICGKASLELVHELSSFLLPRYQPKVNLEAILLLFEQLLIEQTLFNLTGGNHAAALFSVEQELLFLKEDVGRHNALDKIIGIALQKEMIPLKNRMLLLSGRIGFELIQKALLAGIPIVVGVGAPSSLAVELAEDQNMTLIGFLKKDRCNIYSGGQRVTFSGKLTVST